MRKTTRFHMVVSVTYDEAHSTQQAAIEDFYRMLAETEQAGFMDRQIIDISYGEPVGGSVFLFDADPPDEDLDDPHSRYAEDPPVPLAERDPALAEAISEPDDEEEGYWHYTPDDLESDSFG